MVSLELADVLRSLENPWYSSYFRLCTSPNCTTCSNRSCSFKVSRKTYSHRLRPHHRERTIKLFDEFVTVIGNISNTILIEIYDVAGREESVTVSSKDIEKILKQNENANVTYAADLQEAENLIREQAKNFDVIFIIGGETPINLRIILFAQKS